MITDYEKLCFLVGLEAVRERLWIRALETWFLLLLITTVILVFGGPFVSSDLYAPLSEISPFVIGVGVTLIEGVSAFFLASLSKDTVDLIGKAITYFVGLALVLAFMWVTTVGLGHLVLGFLQ